MSLPIPDPLIPEVFRDFLASLGLNRKGRDLSPAIFVVLSIFCWPIALALRYVRSPLVRISICVLLGVGTMVAVYGGPIVAVFACFNLLFYIPCRFRLLSPGWITVVVLAVLGWIHYDSMLSNTAKDQFSYTGTLMMMAAKVSMFAFHVRDGHLLRSKEPLSTHPHIAEHREQTAISTPVSVWEYMAYNFEFLGGLVGPLLTYREYMDFIHLRGDFSKLHSVKLFWPSVKAIARAVLILGVYLFVQASAFLRAETLLSEEFVANPLWLKVILAPFIIMCCRQAYFAVWCLSEVACTLSGLAFHPPHRFDRGRNINIKHFELSQNFNQVTNNWNIRISQLWLKNCIYQRIDSVPGILRPLISSKKALANLTTKITSALWHGWYAGYTMSFVSLGLGNWSETMVRKHLHGYIPDKFFNSRAASVLAWVHTWVSVNVFFGPFLLLEWEKAKLFNSAIHWSIHLYHIAIIVVMAFIPTPHAKRAHKKHQ